MKVQLVFMIFSTFSFLYMQEITARETSKRVSMWHLHSNLMSLFQTHSVQAMTIQWHHNIMMSFYGLWCYFSLYECFSCFCLYWFWCLCVPFCVTSVFVCMVLYLCVCTCVYSSYFITLNRMVQDCQMGR